MTIIVAIERIFDKAIYCYITATRGLLNADRVQWKAHELTAAGQGASPTPPRGLLPDAHRSRRSPQVLIHLVKVTQVLLFWRSYSSSPNSTIGKPAAESSLIRNPSPFKEKRP